MPISGWNHRWREKKSPRAKTKKLVVVFSLLWRLMKLWVYNESSPRKRVDERGRLREKPATGDCGGVFVPGVLGVHKRATDSASLLLVSSGIWGGDI